MGFKVWKENNNRNNGIRNIYTHNRNENEYSVVRCVYKLTWWYDDKALAIGMAEYIYYARRALSLIIVCLMSNRKKEDEMCLPSLHSMLRKEIGRNKALGTFCNLFISSFNFTNGQD